MMCLTRWTREVSYSFTRDVTYPTRLTREVMYLTRKRYFKHRFWTVRVPPLNIFGGGSRPMRSLGSGLSTNHRPRFQTIFCLWLTLEAVTLLRLSQSWANGNLPKPVKLQISSQVDIHWTSTWLPIYNHLTTTSTWMPLDHHLNTTLLPMDYHLNTTCLPLDFHLNSTWPPLDFHLNATWLPLDYYLTTNWLPLDYHLTTT